MADVTETFADWSCEHCDTSNQLFLEKDGNGWWKPTQAGQEMLEFHVDGDCSDGDV